MDLKNKVIIITGASSGIGKELGFQLARKGSKVVLAARSEKKLTEIAKEIEARGGEALVVTTDVSVRAQVENLVSETIQKWGRIDIFINNAGVTHATADLVNLEEDDVRRVMETNFMSGIFSVWAAAPHMEKAGGGQLVFVSSVVGKRGVPRNSVYCASKFALQGLTESIRLELKKKKINVMAVLPPGVDTPFYTNNGRGDARTFWLHSVEKISSMIVKACENEDREVLMTLDSKLIHYGNVFFPRLTDWAVAKNKKIEGE